MLNKRYTDMMADHRKVMQLLKTARGQIDSVIKMVEDDRYCIDISTQILAAEGLLNNANRMVVTAHLKNCVNDAPTAEDRNRKIDEVANLLTKILK